MRRGRRPLTPENVAKRQRFGALLFQKRKRLGKSLREMAKAIDPEFDHTRLAHIESGRRPVNGSDLYKVAHAYKVPWTVLRLALDGQFALVLPDSLWQAGDQHDEHRDEVFTAYVTAKEKAELAAYLEYLLFLQETGQATSMPGAGLKSNSER